MGRWSDDRASEAAGGPVVSFDIWVVHYSKEIWGEDDRVFNPNRGFREDARRLERYFIP
jgi:hypothetical protein